MANSIDIGAIAIGMAVGYGLKNELRSAGNVCKNALLAAATVAAATTAAAVEGAKEEAENPQSQQPVGQTSQNGN